MSNDKDFDRFFKETFENWSLEPSEEGVQKMAAKLNAMENARLDSLFLTKLKSLTGAVSYEALKRMKWMLFWRKHRAALTGSALALLLALSGLAWWGVQEKSEPSIPSVPNSSAALPSNSASDADTESAETEASSSNSQTTGENRSDALNDAHRSETAQTIAQNPVAPSRFDRTQTHTNAGNNAETDEPSGAAQKVTENNNALVASTEPKPFGPGESAEDEGMDESNSEEIAVGEEEQEENVVEEGEIESHIPAAPWRSFKPLNWHYALGAGLDVGIHQNQLTATPHFGFRVTRLINPLVSLNSGLNYVQRGRISEALCYTDTVYHFGMSLQQREAHPIRMHFVEVPLYVEWQFAPGQFIHAGASASYAFMHQVEEIVHEWTPENALVPHSTEILNGSMPELASWDVAIKLGYGLRFNPRWGAVLGGTVGLRDMTPADGFQNDGLPVWNRNIWVNAKVYYQLNRVK